MLHNKTKQSKEATISLSLFPSSSLVFHSSLSLYFFLRPLLLPPFPLPFFFLLSIKDHTQSHFSLSIGQEMENNTIRPQHDRENLSSLNSPNTNGKTNMSNNMNTNNNNNSNTYNGAVELGATPLTPRSISSRSDTNPYPTTFVQADTTNFKQVVQMLTGSSETVKQAASTTTSKPNQTQDHQPAMSIPKAPPPPPPPSSSSSSSIPPKKQGFKLYERRNNNQLKNSLIINTLVPGFAQNSGFSPRKPEILSPSMLDFPKLALSPVTPLNNEDPFDKSSSPSLGSSSEEDRAIAEKGFYLHPSPMSTPRGVEPQLLPLFPVTSPRVSGASS